MDKKRSTQSQFTRASRRLSPRAARKQSKNSSLYRQFGTYDMDTGEYGYDDTPQQPTVRRRDLQSRGKRKRSKLKIVLIALVLVCLLSGGGILAYLAILEGNLHAGLGANIDDVLVESDVVNEPFYMLLLGTDGSSERDGDEGFGGSYRSDSILLARIDAPAKKATLISLHRDTLLNMGENGNQKLNTAYALGGPSYMVETVSKLAGVPISHYAEVNFDGFKEIVDTLGGVDVDVPIEINDQDAGGFVPAGQQHLSGDQALILCRSRHTYEEFGDGDSFRAANQRLVLSAIAKKLFTSDIVTMTTVVQAMSRYITTDLSLTEILALAQALNGMNVSTDLYTAMEPTTSVYIDGDGWYELNDLENWRKMMGRVNQGLPPTEEAIVDDASGTILATNGDGSLDPSDPSSSSNSSNSSAS